MKKLFSIILCIALLAAMSVSFASCASKTTVPISFGKKYQANDENYYIFNSDHTGVMTRKSTSSGYTNPEFNYTLSGTVDFVWREASNGAVYLFKVEVHYNEDHTEGKYIDIIDAPIYFSDDCFSYTTYTQYGDSTHHYILEGSDLEKSLEK